MPVLITNYDEIRLGIVSEDCAFHPCLCTKVDPEADEVQGISLIDGSAPRCCSVKHCGLKALTMDEAVRWKCHGPGDPADSGSIPVAERWW
jgi:hypothetical protein